MLMRAGILFGGEAVVVVGLMVVVAVGVVVVAAVRGMSLKDDGEGSKGDAVMIVGGGACTGSCGVSDRYCCRLHGVI